MADRDDNSEIVEIDFEVGHISIIRAEPTTNHNPPRTHDWKIYLRSADVRGDLNCLIQKCIFYLHPEYPNHKRELRSTPFAIQESGYGGFHLPIEIYFKTKKEPKKYRIEYDLDLHTNIEGHPQRQKESHVRKYRCTFYNPDPEFRQKILAAGGKIRDNSSLSTNNNGSEESESEEVPNLPEPIARHSPPQKRPSSPVVIANPKKVKVEQPTVNPKKKQPPPPPPQVMKNESSSKPTVNNLIIKKPQPTSSTKPLIEEKPTKIIPTNGSTKIKPDPDSKPAIPSSTNSIPKKKEAVPSPSKPSTSITLKKPIQLPTNRPPQKISTKIESTSMTSKSPSNVNIKRESSPNLNPPSNSTNSTVLISSLKKIPKKIAPPPPPPPPPVVERRPRSPMTPPPSNRNSDRDSHRHQSSSSKSQSSSKRDRPLTPPASSSSINNSTSSRNSSSSNRSGKHSANSSSHRGRSRSRSRSRSHSRHHHSHHSSRSHHSSSSSRHSSQQKDRSSHYTSSHHSHRRTPTPSKSTRSPLRSHPDLPSSNNDLSMPPSTTSINTPQSRPDSVEPTTTSSPSTHVFPNDDDHTQAPMDIDGQSDDDAHFHRQIRLSSDEHDQISPLSSTFLPIEPTKNFPTRNFHSDHSDSLSDTNESNDDSNQSINHDDEEDDDNDDLPMVLTDDGLRSKLIFIYNRFTLNSNTDLSTFVTFFKRHHLIDVSSKSTNGMFTYDLFSLNPILIEELATDLGYTNNS